MDEIRFRKFERVPRMRNNDRRFAADLVNAYNDAAGSGQAEYSRELLDRLVQLISKGCIYERLQKFSSK